jgi:hypothetical protein
MPRSQTQPGQHHGWWWRQLASPEPSPALSQPPQQRRRPNAKPHGLSHSGTRQCPATPQGPATRRQAPALPVAATRDAAPPPRGSGCGSSHPHTKRPCHSDGQHHAFVTPLIKRQPERVFSYGQECAPPGLPGNDLARTRSRQVSELYRCSKLLAPTLISPRCKPCDSSKTGHQRSTMSCASEPYQTGLCQLNAVHTSPVDTERQMR